MEAIVKFRSISFLVEVQDPFRPGETKMAMRVAEHGQKVTTEPRPDSFDAQEPNTVYGMTEYDFNRNKYLGAFFSDLEIDMLQAGVTDLQTVREAGEPLAAGDTTSTILGSNSDASPITPVGGSTNVHPLAFGEITEEQLAGYILERELSVNDLLKMVEANPDAADKILNAEFIATGSDPREGLAEGIAAIRSGGGIRGPEGSEGVEGSGELRTGESATTAPSSSSTYTGSKGGPDDLNATDEAVALAKENDLDLSEVEGTGAEGRILKSDVEKAIKEKGE
jgi:pyruvate/2-oxoglutarate dehydrogenase complex dihydrolipoamide acyltransferase (E2) component